MAATPLGAWVIGPSLSPACCGARAWIFPAALAFAAALTAAMAAWMAVWLLLPGFDAFRPVCRLGAFLAG